MTKTGSTLTLLLNHPGFPPLDDQRSAESASTGTERVLDASDTQIWQQALEELLSGLQPGDVVWAHSLTVLAPSLEHLVHNLAALAAQGAHLRTGSEEVDTSADSALLNASVALQQAGHTAEDHRTRAALAAPTPARGVTPPHARAVSLTSYQRVTAHP